MRSDGCYHCLRRTPSKVLRLRRSGRVRQNGVPIALFAIRGPFFEMYCEKPTFEEMSSPSTIDILAPTTLCSLSVSRANSSNAASRISALAGAAAASPQATKNRRRKLILVEVRHSLTRLLTTGLFNKAKTVKEYRPSHIVQRRDWSTEVMPMGSDQDRMMAGSLGLTCNPTLHSIKRTVECMQMWIETCILSPTDCKSSPSVRVLFRKYDATWCLAS